VAKPVALGAANDRVLTRTAGGVKRVVGIGILLAVGLKLGFKGFRNGGIAELLSSVGITQRHAVSTKKGESERVQGSVSVGKRIQQVAETFESVSNAGTRRGSDAELKAQDIDELTNALGVQHRIPCGRIGNIEKMGRNSCDRRRESGRNKGGNRMRSRVSRDRGG
jgi:hypothetical protein